MAAAFQARFPSAAVPERLYYCAATAAHGAPPTIDVTTDGRVEPRACPMPRSAVPDNVDAKAYTHAVELGLKGIPTIRVIKADGVHQQVMYTAPVRTQNHRVPIGVLIGIDVPSDDPESPTPTPSPEDVERAMIAEMLRANLAAAE